MLEGSILYNKTIILVNLNVLIHDFTKMRASLNIIESQLLKPGTIFGQHQEPRFWCRLIHICFRSSCKTVILILWHDFEIILFKISSIFNKIISSFTSLFYNIILMVRIWLHKSYFIMAMWPMGLLFMVQVV